MYRYLAIYMDYGNCYYEADRPFLIVSYHETLEEAKKALKGQYPSHLVDMETRQEVY